MNSPIERNYLARAINYHDIDNLVGLVQEAYNPNSDTEKTEKNLAKSDIGVSKLVRHQLENNQQILDTTNQIIHATQYPLETLDSQVKTIMRLNKLALESAQAIPEMEQSIPLDALTRSFLLALRSAASFTKLVSKLYPIYQRNYILADALDDLNKKKEKLIANPSDPSLSSEIRGLEELIVHESKEQAAEVKKFFGNFVLDTPSIALKSLMSLDLLKIPTGPAAQFVTPLIFISGLVDLYKDAGATNETNQDLNDLKAWIEKNISLQTHR